MFFSSQFVVASIAAASEVDDDDINSSDDDASFPSFCAGSLFAIVILDDAVFELDSSCTGALVDLSELEIFFDTTGALAPALALGFFASEF